MYVRVCLHSFVFTPNAHTPTHPHTHTQKNRQMLRLHKSKTAVNSQIYSTNLQDSTLPLCKIKHFNLHFAFPICISDLNFAFFNTFTATKEEECAKRSNIRRNNTGFS